jgi:hypothetical protein
MNEVRVVPDPVEIHSVAEPSNVVEPAPQRPRGKSSGRKGTKRPTRKASTTGARAVSTVRLKVGGRTIALPKSLAAYVTAKDEKRLLAIFKRILKRQKRGGVKKRATKKR